jgi:outer membrane protein
MKINRTTFAMLALLCTGLHAQDHSSLLPNAPSPSSMLTSDSQSTTVAATDSPLHLTRQQAEKMAIAQNPGIHISQLIAKVQHQAVRERRADELPNLNGNLTAVAANDGSRISSGSLTASRLLQHAGMGVQFSQLITDFGRTSNLVASARLQEKAKLADAEASNQAIVLATDQVFFSIIEAQETLKVAIETVSARQAISDQIQALTNSKLKSDLDLSFA